MWQADLRGIPMTVPWSDHVLHFALPAFAIAGWVLGPGRRTARWSLIAGVLAFPVVWGLVTMWRGSRIGWYPYYFLDLRQVSGVGEFLLTSAFALAVFAGVASGLIGLSRWRPTARVLRPGGRVRPGSLRLRRREERERVRRGLSRVVIPELRERARRLAADEPDEDRLPGDRLRRSIHVRIAASPPTECHTAASVSQNRSSKRSQTLSTAPDPAASIALRYANGRAGSNSIDPCWRTPIGAVTITRSAESASPLLRRRLTPVES